MWSVCLLAHLANFIIFLSTRSWNYLFSGIHSPARGDRCKTLVPAPSRPPSPKATDTKKSFQSVFCCSVCDETTALPVSKKIAEPQSF